MNEQPNIVVRFAARYADFALQTDLDLPGCGLTVLFGPSGSGKTTLLRAIAGLEHHRGGFIEVNGEVWQDDAQGIFMPPHRRAIGYVFQEACLFPHLSVKRNLEYGQRRIKASSSSEARIDMAHVLGLLGIAHLLDRQPIYLSGGERQRVAIARALMTEPKLLLMDEPLAALDHQRKQEILPYLEKLHRELSIPIIYVTHSPEEMARLADHVVLLDAGKVVASGSLLSTLSRLDLPLALSGDAGVVIEGTVAATDAQYHLMTVEFSGSSIQTAHQSHSPGERIRLRILAKDVGLTLTHQQGTSVLNQLSATVLDQAPADTAAHVMLRLNVGGTVLLARITRRSCDELNITSGKQVWAQIKAVAVLAER